MLPYACLDSVLYTHEIRVYYSTQSQDEYGRVARKWTFDRTERCITKQSNVQMYEVAQQNTWNDTLIGQSEEDLRIDSDGNIHAASEVLITFVTPKRIDTVGPRAGLATTYELRASSPIDGMFGEVLHFDIVLVRSIDQNVVSVNDFAPVL